MREKQSDVAHFMRRAIELSFKNVRSGKGGPFAALIVKSGKILAEGTNVVASANDPTAHAEIVAIRNACKKIRSFELSGCAIYANCEPCPMCLGAIYWARLARIYFAATSVDAAKIGFDDALLYQQLKRTATARKIPMSQLMREDALKVFRLWEQKPDKIEY
jgi:guanine deaminase